MRRELSQLLDELHDGLLAIEARDGDRAALLMRRHLESVGLKLLPRESSPLNAADNAIPRYRRDLAATRRALGQLLLAEGRIDEARQALERSQRLLEELVRQFPTNQDYAAQLEATVSTLREVPESTDQSPASGEPATPDGA